MERETCAKVRLGGRPRALQTRISDAPHALRGRILSNRSRSANAPREIRDVPATLAFTFTTPSRPARRISSGRRRSTAHRLVFFSVSGGHRGTSTRRSTTATTRRSSAGNSTAAEYEPAAYLGSAFGIAGDEFPSLVRIRFPGLTALEAVDRRRMHPFQTWESPRPTRDGRRVLAMTVAADDRDLDRWVMGDGLRGRRGGACAGESPHAHRLPTPLCRRALRHRRGPVFGQVVGVCGRTAKSKHRLHRDTIAPAPSPRVAAAQSDRGARATPSGRTAKA